MKWIEEKMKLLGCDRHSGYKLAFYLDSRAMISIHTEKYGVIEVRISVAHFTGITGKNQEKPGKTRKNREKPGITAPIILYFFCHSEFLQNLLWQILKSQK